MRTFRNATLLIILLMLQSLTWAASAVVMHQPNICDPDQHTSGFAASDVIHTAKVAPLEIESQTHNIHTLSAVDIADNPCSTPDYDCPECRQHCGHQGCMHALVSHQDGGSLSPVREHTPKLLPSILSATSSLLFRPPKV